MEYLILLILVEISNFLMLLIGITLANNKKINPIKCIQEHKEQKQIQQNFKKQNEIDEINMYNINHYDGSSTGQKDFPN